MKDIKEITIQFENCETYTFKREELLNFFIGGIKKNIHLCANAVIEEYESDSILISIPIKYAKKKRKSFGFLEEENIIDRTKRTKDITNIWIKYNDDKEESIGCPWIGDNEFNNPAQQTTLMDHNGNSLFIISISRDN